MQVAYRMQHQMLQFTAIKKKGERRLDPHTFAQAMDQGNRVWFLQDKLYLHRNWTGWITDDSNGTNNPPQQSENSWEALQASYSPGG